MRITNEGARRGHVRPPDTNTRPPKQPEPGEDYTGWMYFFHSGALHLPTLTPDRIDVRDIANGLSHVNRWNGQSRKPISVAWHSMAVAHAVKEHGPATMLRALFHDAAEAYTGDLIRPLAPYAGNELKQLQNRIQQACFEACGVADPTRHDPVVKWADNLMLRYEMNSHWGYGRIASWRQPLTDAEQTHADEAAARTGFPDENPHTQYVRFIRMAALLTPISALLRTSIDNAGQAELPTER